MDHDYAVRYETLYRHHWWWRAREHLVVSVLRQLRPAGGWNHVLDVGCGNGLLFDRLLALGASHVEGVESDESLVSAKSRWQASIHVGEFGPGFVTTTRYDLILMLDVLEHIPEAYVALKTALALLTREGRLLITVPAHRELWTGHDDLNAHVTRYTKRTLAGAVEAAGGSVESLRYFFHWIAPVKLAVRAIEAVGERRRTVPRVPPPLVNQALYWLSRAEQRIPLTGGIPFGSSLLAVVSP